MTKEHITTAVAPEPLSHQIPTRKTNIHRYPGLEVKIQECNTSLLFNLYLRNLPPPEGIELLTYAGDCTIIIKDNNIPSMCQQLDIYLKKLTNHHTIANASLRDATKWQVKTTYIKKLAS